MRELYLLSGPPCAGKSTWVKENNLTLYTLDIDIIRSMMVGPVYDRYGNLEVDMSENDKAWGYLFSMLENRMSRGETVLVDALNLSYKFYLQYIILAQRYFYKIYKINFFTVPFDELMKRNAERVYPKKLDEAVLFRIYNLFQYMQVVYNDLHKQLVEDFLNIEIITPDEAVRKLYKSSIVDLNNYDKVVVFGNIGFSYKELEDYFFKNPFNASTFYIFTGGYFGEDFDVSAVELLSTLYDKENVVLLEDNTIRYIKAFVLNFISKNPIDVNKFYIPKEWQSTNSKLEEMQSFASVVLSQLDSIDKNRLKQLCYSVLPFYNFIFHGKTYTVLYSFLSTIPNRFISCKECFYGTVNNFNQNVGQFFWDDNTKENEFSICCNGYGFTGSSLSRRSKNIYDANKLMIYSIG